MAFEIDATPGSANAGKVTRGYFHGPGLNEVLAVDQFAGGEAKTVWQFADHAGTVETVGTHTHSGGWRLLHRSVDEVGRTDVPFAGTTDVTLGETGDAWLKAVPAVFAGHRLDETTGLWETPDRWYDAQTQRHLSEDPLGDGTNLYAFADGDPVNPGGVSAASTPRLSEWLEEAGDYFEDQGAIPISIASHTLSAVATLFDGTVADSIRGEAAASRESITRAMADGGVLGGLGGYAALGLNYAGEALAQYGLMAGAAGVAAPPALLAGHAAIGATPAWAAPWVVNPYTAGAARTFGAALGAYQTVTSGADAYRHYQSGVLSGSDFAFVSAGLAGTYASATTRLLVSPVRATRELADEIATVGPPRSRQTIALIETKQGQTIVAGGSTDLTNAQKTLARRQGLLVADDLPGFHAEITGIYHAGRRGLTPTRGITNNQVCRTGKNNCVSQLHSFAAEGGFSFLLSSDGRSFEFASPSGG